MASCYNSYQSCSNLVSFSLIIFPLDRSRVTVVSLMLSDLRHLRHRYSQCGHWPHHGAQHGAAWWQRGAWYCHCYCGQLDRQTFSITHSQCRHLLLRLPISWSTLTTNTWLTWQWFSSQITPSWESEPSLSSPCMLYNSQRTHCLILAAGWILLREFWQKLFTGELHLQMLDTACWPLTDHSRQTWHLTGSYTCHLSWPVCTLCPASLTQY